MHIGPKSIGFYLKCMNAFFKRQCDIKFRRICFLLNESPDRLFKNPDFRELVTRGVFVPKKEHGNPDQEYFVDYYRLRKLVIESDLIQDLIRATDGKIGEIL